MGLMDKVKNLFSDEIEEEEKPIKKEVMHVEIESPKQEEKDSDITESEAIKKEEKFVFPVYFDDKDFDTLDYSKPQEPVSVKPKGSYALNKPTPNEEKKDFKPSPIISPVYGVLDKNYSKDDIASRPSKKIEEYHNSKEVTIDDVRKKAFGTLEEELETEMFSQNSILFNDEPDSLEDDRDMFDEFEDKEENSDNDNVSRISIEEELTFEVYDELDNEESKQSESTNMVENELNHIDEEDDLTEGDLFNLIDSMYEKKEDN